MQVQAIHALEADEQVDLRNGRSSTNTSVYLFDVSNRIFYLLLGFFYQGFILKTLSLEIAYAGIYSSESFALLVRYWKRGSIVLILSNLVDLSNLLSKTTSFKAVQ
jgi:hypothetical protein